MTTGDNDRMSGQDVAPKARTLLSEAMEAMERGGSAGLEQCLALAVRAVEAAPQWSRAHHVQGLALMHLGMLEDSRTALERAVSLDESSAEAFYDLGVAWMMLESYPEAAEAFERALAIDPVYGEARRNLGMAYTAMGSPVQALAHLRQALTELEGDAETLFGLGNTLMALDDPDRAVDWFGHALQADPSHVMAMNGQASALMALGEWELAQGWLEQALSLAPDFIQARINLGSLLLSQGDARAAETHYRLAVDMVPTFAPSWTHLGLVLEELGRMDRAEAAHDKALECDPDDPEALNGLAGFLIRQKRFEQALTRLEEAESRLGGHPGLWFNKGQALQGLEAEEDEVRAAYERCLELDPDDAWGAGLKLASMGMADLPEQVSLEHLKRIYAGRASFWEASEDNGYQGPELVRKAIETVLPDTDQLTVLDAGCGTGSCASFLRPMASRLDGVDLSPEMIRLARAKGLYDHLETGELLSFLDENQDCYDLIACAGVLFYFRDMDRVFQALANALRPGGVVACTLFVQESGETCMTGQGYFIHQVEQVEHAAGAAGFQWEYSQEAVHEFQDGQPVPCLVAVLVKTE